MGEEAKQEAPKEETEAVETPEEKKEVKAEENEKQEPKPPSPLVLSMDLHCMGCVKKIERIILKIRGVEGVMTDMGQNQVTVKGVVEPEAVRGTVEKKTRRKVEILSPLPEAEGQPIPQVVASQVSDTTTVELNVNMHCEACAAQLKRIILKMKGVATVETELSSSKVTVTGTMEADKLVDYVYRRTRKQAKVVPQPEPEPENPKEEEKPHDAPPAAEDSKTDQDKKEEAGDKPSEVPQADNKEGGEGEGKVKKEEEANQQVVEMVNSEEHQQSIQKMMYYSDYQPLYFIERVPPPQLFSDENPNACCII